MDTVKKTEVSFIAGLVKCTVLDHTSVYDSTQFLNIVYMINFLYLQWDQWKPFKKKKIKSIDNLGYENSKNY